jgi:hypothetical protein
MTGEKDVIRGRKSKVIGECNVRLEGLGLLEAFAVAPAEDVGCNHQLVSTHLRLLRHLIGVNIDKLHYPV